jgi:multisubunit Na+/H+ antiporter MnhB subunit
LTIIACWFDFSGICLNFSQHCILGLDLNVSYWGIHLVEVILVEVILVFVVLEVMVEQVEVMNYQLHVVFDASSIDFIQ